MTSLLALVATLALSVAPGQKQLRFGIIGTGCIGQEHIRNLHLIEEATVVAIADTHAPSRDAALDTLRSLGDDADVCCVSDYRELLALPQVDAVLVATPNDHHRECLRDVAASGKHCLVEKPLCIDVAGCAEAEALEARVAAAAVARGAPPPLFWVGMEYRYMPTISKLIAEADAGVVGELRMLTIREHRFPFLRKVDNWNRYTERTGGTLVEKCCHFFDLMRRITRSEPVRVLASGGQDVNHRGVVYDDGTTSDILDNAYVVVEMASGARAMLELCMFAESSKHQEEISLVGTRGKLEAFAPSHGVRTDDPSLTNYRRGLRNPAFATGEWELTEPPPADELGSLHEEHIGVDARLLEAGNHAGATHAQLSAFARAALSGDAAAVPLSDGSKAVLLGLAAHRSIETGQPVLWSDMLDEFSTARAAFSG